jgi:hypothetical protein
MGVTGIFLDEAGYDFGVTRERQNAIVRYIHALGLKAFLNAFDPDDVFGSARTPINGAGGGNPAGLGHALGADDAFLLESFQVRLGEYEDARMWAARTAKAAAYRDRFGTTLFATTTTERAEHYRPEVFAYAWWSAVLWDMDGFGWGEPGFSGASSQLPWRPREAEGRVRPGRRFTASVVPTATGFARRADHGIVTLDLRTRDGDIVPAAGR